MGPSIVNCVCHVNLTNDYYVSQNMGRGHLQLHFQNCSFWKCKNKKFSEAFGWSKKSFVRRFENDTFESVFFKSVEIESVVVSKAYKRGLWNGLLCNNKAM